MRLLPRAFGITVLAVALAATAGCIPRWTAAALRYAESACLYSAGDPSQQVMQASSGQHYLIIDLELAFSSSQPADIRNELVFGLYDCYGDDVRYNNFYPTEGTVFDAIGFLAGKDAPLGGSLFFIVPDSFTSEDAVFVVMNQYYETIHSASLASLLEVQDYPGSW